MTLHCVTDYKLLHNNGSFPCLQLSASLPAGFSFYKYLLRYNWKWILGLLDRASL